MLGIHQNPTRPNSARGAPDQTSEKPLRVASQKDAAYLSHTTAEIVGKLWNSDWMSLMPSRDSSTESEFCIQDVPVAKKILSDLSFGQMHSRRKSLIPFVVPRQWMFYNIAGTDATAPSWTLSEPKESLETLCSFHRQEFRLIIFLDGLDEFDGLDSSDGNPSALLDWISDTLERYKVKFCVSSRPMNHFADTFREYRSLAMQQLTRRDIQAVVEAKFGNSAAYQEIKVSHPKDADRLVREIIDKAEEQPEPSLLWERLSSIPGDIEGLYNSIWSSIPPKRLATTSKILQTYRAQDIDTSLVAFWLACVDANTKASAQLAPTEELLKTPRRRDVFDFARSGFSRIHRIPVQARINRDHMVLSLDNLNRIACDIVVAGCKSGNISHQLAAYANGSSPERFSRAGWPTLMLGENITHLELSFVGTAASAGFTSYVKAKVEADPSFLVPKRGRVSLLENAIFPYLYTVWEIASSDAFFLPDLKETREQRLKIIELLLGASDVKHETALGCSMCDAVHKAMVAVHPAILDSLPWYEQVLPLLKTHGYTANHSGGERKNEIRGGTEDEANWNDVPVRWRGFSGMAEDEKGKSANED
ncbi:hypothetical protein CHGG_04144 [Chaetomium globosum CBS 148.51]|uniref:NACHT domain-containing protein n=1 Tax=Chaetomium globosum (strain ATCC 6205 / CBS 148.51 / DSM 1962 / NBRC 6347 / NRRL 1970) TaxID=306901 RepID=Q2H252_CHAGB|nr:uncharacterized protein CHGG_04144 [Chaetomium globosum CBS 148.51]EAQ87525.1 hypothetical protein CHGG_04144 [Chaetomium globosum CBS 148.51]